MSWDTTTCGFAAPPGRARHTDALRVAVTLGRAGAELNVAVRVMYRGRERPVDELRALASPHGLMLNSVAVLTDQRHRLFHSGAL